MSEISQERLKEILDRVASLTWEQEREELRQMALAALAKAYGDDEPEYTLADIKS
jgi:hypothetical protein